MFGKQRKANLRFQIVLALIPFNFEFQGLKKALACNKTGAYVYLVYVNSLWMQDSSTWLFINEWTKTKLFCNAPIELANVNESVMSDSKRVAIRIKLVEHYQGVLNVL